MVMIIQQQCFLPFFIIVVMSTAVLGDAANTAVYFSRDTSKKAFASFMALSGRFGSLRIMGMVVNTTYIIHVLGKGKDEQNRDSSHDKCKGKMQ